MPDLNQIDSYDYELPDELIAQFPTAQRDRSRLMLLHRESGEIEHRQFSDLPQLLNPGDCLVLNQTRVVPARLRGERDATGGRWEGLFLQLLPDQHWQILSKTRGKLQAGETITISAADGSARLQLRLLEKDSQGRWSAVPVSEEDRRESPWVLLDRIGSIPLPPYIQQGQANEEDRERYQTVYAHIPGAVAAPTAGLHFTPELLDACRQKGIGVATVTLHVGLGTFRPIAVEDLDEHEMHAEWCEIDQTAVDQILTTQQNNGRVIAVGTTTVRTLETAAQSGTLQSWQGESQLFIRPGFEFHAIDGLITNYHLPKSTLLVLLSAFAGYEQTMNAYRIAVEEKYRFYSYGDAMLIL